MARPAAVTAMVICDPSDMWWPWYKSNIDDDENDDDKEALAPWESYFGEESPWKKSFDESFKTGTRDDWTEIDWKGATDGATYNAILPPTAPKYDSPYFHLPASSDSMPSSDGEKSGLSAAERKEK